MPAEPTDHAMALITALLQAQPIFVVDQKAMGKLHALVTAALAAAEARGHEALRAVGPTVRQVELAHQLDAEYVRLTEQESSPEEAGELCREFFAWKLAEYSDELARSPEFVLPAAELLLRRVGIQHAALCDYRDVIVTACLHPITRPKTEATLLETYAKLARAQLASKGG